MSWFNPVRESPKIFVVVVISPSVSFFVKSYSSRVMSIVIFNFVSGKLAKVGIWIVILYTCDFFVLLLVF